MPSAKSNCTVSPKSQEALELPFIGIPCRRRCQREAVLLHRGNRGKDHSQDDKDNQEDRRPSENMRQRSKRTIPENIEFRWSTGD